MLPLTIRLCAYSAHTKLSAHLQQAARIRLSAVVPVHFASDNGLAATLEKLRVANVRLISPITPFATEEHAYQSSCVFRPPLWLCADFHLGCCPQGTTCCGENGCCKDGVPVSTKATATPTSAATTTNIGGAVGGTIGGLLLTGASVAAWYF